MHLKCVLNCAIHSNVVPMHYKCIFNANTIFKFHKGIYIRMFLLLLEHTLFVLAEFIQSQNGKMEWRGESTGSRLKPNYYDKDV